MSGTSPKKLGSSKKREMSIAIISIYRNNKENTRQQHKDKFLEQISILKKYGNFDVYLIDWGSPTRKHAGYTLATYVTKLLPEFLQAVRDHSGKQSLSLHGWSMGGGFALCYQAYTRDPDIRNIVTVGTALDGHANGQIGRQYAALNRALKAVGINFRRVPSSAAYAPAWINAIGFKLSDPVSSVQGYVDLIRNLDDREFMIQHANQECFYG